jgi:hypothetical protein
MDKSFVMVLVSDIETAMKVLGEGLEKDDVVLAREAFGIAEKEFATLRRIILETPPALSREALKT